MNLKTNNPVMGCYRRRGCRCKFNVTVSNAWLSVISMEIGKTFSRVNRCRSFWGW